MMVIPEKEYYRTLEVRGSCSVQAGSSSVAAGLWYHAVEYIGLVWVTCLKGVF